MSMTDISDRIGELKDKISNLRGAMEIPMPAEFHLKQLKSELIEIEEQLKSTYIELSDCNPWREE